MFTTWYSYTTFSVLLCCLHISCIQFLFIDALQSSLTSANFFTGYARGSEHRSYDQLSSQAHMKEHHESVCGFVITVFTGVHLYRMSTDSFSLPQSGKTLKKSKPGWCGLGRSRQQRELPQGQPAQRKVHRCCDQQQHPAFQQAHAHPY